MTETISFSLKKINTELMHQAKRISKNSFIQQIVFETHHVPAAVQGTWDTSVSKTESLPS